MKTWWVFRHPAHYIAGGIAAWIAQVDVFSALLLILLFVLYEVWQGIRKQDMGYLDLIEFVVTYYIVILGFRIWGVFA